jgi:hypothetical protein
MLEKWVVGLLGAVACTLASAGEEASKPSKAPVQLSDAELDEVTAGGVLSVIIITPGKGSHTLNEHERSIFIVGLGPGTPPSHTIIKTP